MTLVKWCRVLPLVVVGVAMQHARADDAYVIHISVDGLGSSYLQSQESANALPAFARMQTQGAWTNNARTDYDYSVTLPNHTSQITGRPVLGAAGHNWVNNVDPLPGETLHSNKGSYVASIFDVAHDNGLRTSMYVGKSKFSLYDTSYDAAHGAADVTGVNNGTDKIDVYNFAGTAAQVTSAFITDSAALPSQYSFLHFADTDAAGHAFGWGSAEYITAMHSVDTALSQIFTMIDGSATFHNHTYVVLTADHGGGGGDPENHADNTNALNYTIPFYVWGPTVQAGADLYGINGLTRGNPGTGRPSYSDPLQPIRNGDAANLELMLLGLGAVPESSIDALQDLKVAAVPEPGALGVMAVGVMGLVWRRRR